MALTCGEQKLKVTPVTVMRHTKVYKALMITCKRAANITDKCGLVLLAGFIKTSVMQQGVCVTASKQIVSTFMASYTYTDPK